MKVYFNEKNLVDLFNRLRKKYGINHYIIAKFSELDIHTVRDIINYKTNPLSITCIKMFFGLAKIVCDKLKEHTTFASYILNVVSTYYCFDFKEMANITYLDESIITTVIEDVKVCNSITMQIFLGCLSYIANNNDLSSAVIDDLVLGLLYIMSDNIEVKTIIKSGLIAKLILDIFKEQYNITPHKIATIISVDHKSLDKARKSAFLTLKTQMKLYSYVYNKLNGFGDIKIRVEVAETFLARLVVYYYLNKQSITIKNLTIKEKIIYAKILISDYKIDKLIAFNSLNLELEEHYKYLINNRIK